MERAHGLGLRAQILLALSAAFLVSFSALDVVALSLARRAQEVERERRSEAMAEAVVVALSGTSQTLMPQAMAHLVGRAGVRGIALAAPDGMPRSFGHTPGEPDARTTLPNGDALSLWTLPIDESATSRSAGLMRLYLIVTGSFVLLIVYVALTRLIVRPVEQLTRASERLSRGIFATQAEVRGASEIASLGVTFNRMARELESDRVLLETRLAELERATHELRSAQEQLIRSEKLASVGRLSAGIAHEIGNPLSAILGLVELMQLGGLSEEEQREFLARVRGETERIHRIIRDLLDFSRTQTAPQAGSEVATIERVIEDAIKLVSPQKDVRGVRIERQLAGSGRRVKGSAHELTQLLLNLLLNAADATQGTGSILVEVRDDGPDVLLIVSDSGPGIAAEIMDRLFEPFVTTKPAGKGTGLGLAVSSAILERLGGSIRADNRPGGGASFTVRLPTAAAELPGEVGRIV